jgi:hypothetical protein
MCMGTLSHADSPLAKILLGQYLSCLITETLNYINMPHKELARAMSIQEVVLRDTIDGKVGLARRQWTRLAELLNL